MQDPEDKVPTSEDIVSETVSVPEPTNTVDSVQIGKQFESLSEKFDALTKKVDAYQQAQKQLNIIVKDNLNSQVGQAPTFSWLEKEIQECNFNSDVPIGEALDFDMCGKQACTWYFSDVIEKTQSLEEAKKAALNVMSDVLKAK